MEGLKDVGRRFLSKNRTNEDPQSAIPSQSFSFAGSLGGTATGWFKNIQKSHLSGKATDRLNCLMCGS